MKKRMIALGPAFVIVIMAIVSFQTRNILGNTLTPTKTEEPTINVNYNNIKQVFSKSQIVQDLPKNSIITLSFYNFNTGQRHGKTHTQSEKEKSPTEK